MYENRTLLRGDNLQEMRKLPDARIDLIATDPPFNSNRDYFVPYHCHIHHTPLTDFYFYLVKQQFHPENRLSASEKRCHPNCCLTILNILNVLRVLPTHTTPTFPELKAYVYRSKGIRLQE